MKKEDVMKKDFVLVLLAVFLLIAVFSSSMVSADFAVGNASSGIEKSYAPGEILKGWINISLSNESMNSLISVDSSSFTGSINLLDFLEENEASYSCSPSNCESGYGFLNESTSKTLSIESGQSQSVGFKLTGLVQQINSIKFDLDSDSPKSCVAPLKLDILDDGEENWRFNKASDDFSCVTLRGKCFNSSTEEIKVETGLRCEKVSLIERSAYQIGAWIRKNNTASLKASLYSTEDLSSPIDDCTLPDADVNGGEVSCVISADTGEIIPAGDYYICINAGSSSDYTIQYEQQDEKCGFYDIANFQNTGYNSDYNVFAKAVKYADVAKFTFNNSYFEPWNAVTLEEYVWNYIDDEYNGECSSGCAVPLKITVGATQQVTISDILIDYKTDISNSVTTNKVYELSSTSLSLSSGFLKLDLQHANISAPLTNGNHSLKLYLGDEKVLEETINVITTGITIGKISPTIVPAAYPTEFVALVNATGNRSIESYNWNFGDSTQEQETAENKITHTYSAIGTYTLKLTVTDNTGTEEEKDVAINVVNPKDSANSTLRKYREWLTNITAYVNSMDSWYKSEIEKQANLDDLNSEVDRLENKFEIASTTDEYISIMSDLAKLNVPKNLEISKSSTGVYVPDPEAINPSYLAEALGIEEPEGENRNAIFSWLMSNVNMAQESKTYSFYYEDDSIEPVLTYIKLTIKPKNDYAKDTYLIIDKGYEEIKFKEDYSEKAAGGATSIKFSELAKDSEKNVEFSLSGEIDLLNLPIYISPEFSQLPEISIEPGVCNFNGVCEEADGEDWSNCRADCLPWERILIYLFILLFIAFVVYVIMQEWYKRRYENHLFKNRNDLFNLINFVSNALNQGLDKDEIIKRLDKIGWDKEQVIYAFKKVKGQRTGMWEIPIFRFFEKRKIKKEIEKRQVSRGQISPGQTGSGAFFNRENFRRF